MFLSIYSVHVSVCVLCVNVSEFHDAFIDVSTNIFPFNKRGNKFIEEMYLSKVTAE